MHETITKNEAVLAWHFTDGASLRDGRPLKVKTYRHRGELKLCASGLHACERAIDALQYAPGSHVSRVECSGEIVRDGDKLVCSVRRVLWFADAERTLRAFAAQCALDVSDKWRVPAVVREYLRQAADVAAPMPSEELVASSWSASVAASWAASRAASRDASLAAAWAAARAASWAASRAASRAASLAASWAASRDASLDAKNTRLESMLLALEPKP